MKVPKGFLVIPRWAINIANVLKFSLLSKNLNWYCTWFRDDLSFTNIPHGYKIVKIVKVLTVMGEKVDTILSMQALEHGKSWSWSAHTCRYQEDNGNSLLYKLLQYQSSICINWSHEKEPSKLNSRILGNRWLFYTRCSQNALAFHLHSIAEL